MDNRKPSAAPTKPAQPSSFRQTGLLDHKALACLARDTLGMPLTEMTQIFIAELLMRRDRMLEAARKSDFASIGSHSHALKSSAATFGALKVARYAAGLDRACKTAKPEGIPELLNSLDACCEPTISALRSAAFLVANTKHNEESVTPPRHDRLSLKR